MIGATEPESFPPRTSRPVRAVIAIVGLLAVVQALASRPPTPQPTLFDERRFALYATNLADRGFYGDEAGKWPATVELRAVGYSAHVPPGYPFFLAAFWKIAGSFRAVEFVQALLVGATTVMTMLIALRLFGTAAGIASGLLLVATGVLGTYSKLMLSEVLSVTTLTAGLLVLVVAFERRSTPLLALAGVVLGLATLVRPQSLLLPLALGVWIWFAWGDRRGMAALVLIATFAITLVPWTARNYARLDGFVPVSAMTWANLFLVNNPQATGTFRLPERFVGEDEVRRIRALPELQQEAEWREKVTSYWSDEPGDAFGGWLRNGRVFLTREDAVMRLYYGIAGDRPPRLDERILLILAGAGALSLIAARRLGRSAWPPLIVVAYSMGFFCFFLPEARYRVGMLPMLAVVAAGPAQIAWELLRSAARGRSGTAFA